MYNADGRSIGKLDCASSAGDCIPSTPLPAAREPQALTPRPSGARHVTRRLATECATETEIELFYTSCSYSIKLTYLTSTSTNAFSQYLC